MSFMRGFSSYYDKLLNFLRPFSPDSLKKLWPGDRTLRFAGQREELRYPFSPDRLFEKPLFSPETMRRLHRIYYSWMGSYPKSDEKVLDYLEKKSFVPKLGKHLGGLADFILRDYLEIYPSYASLSSKSVYNSIPELSRQPPSQQSRNLGILWKILAPFEAAYNLVTTPVWWPVLKHFAAKPGDDYKTLRKLVASRALRRYVDLAQLASALSAGHLYVHYNMLSSPTLLTPLGYYHSANDFDLNLGDELSLMSYLFNDWVGKQLGRPSDPVAEMIRDYAWERFKTSVVVAPHSAQRDYKLIPSKFEYAPFLFSPSPVNLYAASSYAHDPEVRTALTRTMFALNSGDLAKNIFLRYMMPSPENKFQPKMTFDQLMNSPATKLYWNSLPKDQRFRLLVDIARRLDRRLESMDEIINSKGSKIDPSRLPPNFPKAVSDARLAISRIPLYDKLWTLFSKSLDNQPVSLSDEEEKQIIDAIVESVRTVLNATPEDPYIRSDLLDVLLFLNSPLFAQTETFLKGLQTNRSPAEEALPRN